MSTSVIVGGSNGIGRHLAQRRADRGDTVFITSRAESRAKEVAVEIGGRTIVLALDLAHPDTIAEALETVTKVDHLVISAIPQYFNTFADFDVAQAVEAVTVKLVGTPRLSEPCMTGLPPTPRWCCSAAWPRIALIPIHCGDHLQRGYRHVDQYACNRNGSVPSQCNPPRRRG